MCNARGGSWRFELEGHLLTGVVISTQSLFLMGRAIPRTADPADIWLRHPVEKRDAWFVWCAVGEWRELLKLMPYELPWIGWHRQGREWTRNHWVRLERLKRFESALDARALG